MQRPGPRQPARQPAASTRLGRRYCDRRDGEQSTDSATAELRELPAGAAPGAEQGGLAFALAGQQAGGKSCSGDGEQQQLQFAGMTSRDLATTVAARDAA